MHNKNIQSFVDSIRFYWRFFFYSSSFPFLLFVPFTVNFSTKWCDSFWWNVLLLTTCNTKISHTKIWIIVTVVWMRVTQSLFYELWCRRWFMNNLMVLVTNTAICSIDILNIQMCSLTIIRSDSNIEFFKIYIFAIVVLTDLVTKCNKTNNKFMVDFYRCLWGEMVLHFKQIKSTDA